MYRLPALALFLTCIIVLVLLTPASQARANEEMYEASGGFLTVPLDHNQGDGEEITLTFAKLESAEVAEGIPTFYFSGGPGQSASRIVKKYVEHGTLHPLIRELMRRGPVYFLDQRGTGDSEPHLRCEAVAVVRSGKPIDKSSYLASLRASLRKCEADQPSLSKYKRYLDTVQSTHDFELLRKQVGAKKIVVAGASYGSHIGLSFIRLYGSRVERAVLGLIEGPDHTLKLPAQFDEALARLDNERVQHGKRRLKPTLTAILGGGEAASDETDLNVSRFELALFVRDHFRSRSIEKLEKFLFDGDPGHLQKYLQRLRKRVRFQPKHYVTDCASFASPARLESIEQGKSESLLGAAINFPLPEICSDVDVERLGAAFRQPVVSGVPVIAFSGALDYRTPVSNATAISAGFKAFVHVVDQAGFHALCKKPLCMSALADFLMTPADELRSSFLAVD